MAEHYIESLEIGNLFLPGTLSVDNIQEYTLDNGVNINSNAFINGNLTVNGTTTSINTTNTQIKDRHLYLNSGYTTPISVTSGLVSNYLPTGVSDTLTSLTTNTIITTGSDTFSPGDIIEIAGTNSDGIYEVLSHVGTTLTIDETPSNDFVQDSLIAETVNATITGVTVSVIRTGTDGVWEVGSGSNGAIGFTDIGGGSVSSLQSSYNNGSGIILTGANGSVNITDNAVPVGTLFDVRDNTPASVFTVSPGNVNVTGTMTATTVVTDLINNQTGNEVAVDANLIPQNTDQYEIGSESNAWLGTWFFDGAGKAITNGSVGFMYFTSSADELFLDTANDTYSIIMSPDQNPNTGDLLIGDAGTQKFNTLNIGSPDTILSSNGNVPIWKTPNYIAFVFNTSPVGAINIPSGVNYIRVTMWGGGGGGAHDSEGGISPFWGGGGGGGSSMSIIGFVAPVEGGIGPLTITVGAGGLGGTNFGLPGENSVVQYSGGANTSAFTLTAYGGGGGSSGGDYGPGPTGGGGGGGGGSGGIGQDAFDNNGGIGGAASTSFAANGGVKGSLGGNGGDGGQDSVGTIGQEGDYVATVITGSGGGGGGGDDLQVGNIAGGNGADGYKGVGGTGGSGNATNAGGGGGAGGPGGDGADGVTIGVGNSAAANTGAGGGGTGDFVAVGGTGGSGYVFIELLSGSEPASLAIL